MLLLLFLGIATEAACPRKLGIAINTGDHDRSMVRVRYSVGVDGWASKAKLKANGVEGGIVIYSSVKRGWMPFGAIDEGVADRCVPVVPCCDGVDLGRSLASAQKMREHTWKRMLEGFPEDTYWFVSTEDDAWWNLTALCDIIDAFPEMPGGRDPSNPMAIAVGRFKWEGWGAFILLNRPLLEIFANDTLLDDCRADLLKPEYAIEVKYRYNGTDYNLDHLIGHCIFHYFPKVLTDVRFVTQHYWPIDWHGRRPNRFWYNGPEGWGYSQRAPDLVADMSPSERAALVGLHHTMLSDLAYLETGDTEPVQLPPAGRCRAWEAPESTHTADPPSALCDIADAECAS